MKKRKVIIAILATLFSIILFFIFSNLKYGTSKDYYIEGIDISNQFSGNLNWNALTDYNDFVIVRAIRCVDTCKTKGESYYSSLVDKNFEKNWISLDELKITKGAYHFFSPGVPADIQFERYKSAVKLKKGDLPPILDIEDKNCDIDEAFKWLKMAEEYYKVKPIIYSEYFFYKILLKSKNPGYPLWLYINESFKMRPSFKNPDCILWQFKHDKKIINFEENVDLNVFLGDSSKLKTILMH
jgi:lysozyme